MSPLNSRTSMDWRWPWHQRSVPIGAMKGVIEVFRREVESTEERYDAATGMIGVSEGLMCLLYRGPGRLVANKDWRARRHSVHGDQGVQHAWRVQLPQRECPPVHSTDLIRVVDNPSDQELTHYVFMVRTITPSTNAWVRTVLCDVEVMHPGLLPEPGCAPVDPVKAETLLAVAHQRSGCCGGGG
jgi:hypothetical protein